MNQSSNFDFQPTLVGDLITLRPLTIDDFDTLYAAASDPLVWEQHPDPTRHRREVFQNNFFDSAIASNSALVVIDNATQQIVGSSRYYEWDAEKGKVAIGYTFLARSHWGGAVNSEMKRLMLDHAFRWAKTVWFHVGSTNWRSRKAMEKIGARFSHEEGKVTNGIEYMSAFYRIDATDYL